MKTRHALRWALRLAGARSEIRDGAVWIAAGPAPAGVREVAAGRGIREEALRDRLGQPISGAFRGTPLRDVLEEVAASAGIPIILDPSVGPAADAPVSRDAKEESAKEFLRAVLGAAGLGGVVKEEALWVLPQS